MSPPPLAACRVARIYRRGRRGPEVVALDGADLVLGAGETLAVVGPSGSGKSTLVRLLLALERPDAGRVLWAGQDPWRLPAGGRRRRRREFGFVPQDPFASLDPLLPVGLSVAEPLVAHRIPGRRRRVAELLELVGLEPALAGRRPHELSGGQRQRAAIARALATGPGVLLLDEPLTALDRPVQRHLVRLLGRLREELEVAILLVAHDLELVHALADRVAVLLAGTVVEEGPAAEVLAHPRHPATRDLLAAASPAGRPRGPGCPYRGACDRGRDRCRLRPPLVPADGPHRAACWFPLR